MNAQILATIVYPIISVATDMAETKVNTDTVMDNISKH